MPASKKQCEECAKLDKAMIASMRNLAFLGPYEGLRVADFAFYLAPLLEPLAAKQRLLRVTRRLQELRKQGLCRFDVHTRRWFYVTPPALRVKVDT